MVLLNWDEQALLDLDKIDLPVAKKIVTKVSWLKEHYDNIIPEVLHYGLKGIYKLRVGDYRVLYRVIGKMITIIMIDHRSRIYKRILWIKNK